MEEVIFKNKDYKIVKEEDGFSLFHQNKRIERLYYMFDIMQALNTFKQTMKEYEAKKWDLMRTR